jgi:chromosome segregation ATPase
MQNAIKAVPKVAIFLAGIAAGALTVSRRDGAKEDAGRGELKSTIHALESRLAAQESANANRFSQIEARLDEHASKLAEVPTTAQIVGAMEELLAKTMASLDDRLKTQAQSIEVLKTTVAQTDGLLERVLESLDSLQTFADPNEVAEDALLHRPAV